MSIYGEYDGDNVFAKILRGEIPAAKVFEDAHVLAFMDAFPQSRGHTLVIAKESKARNILEIEPESLSHLILDVQRVAKAVMAALHPDGLVINQFNGAAAGQSVFHLHFHLIPRWAGRSMRTHGEGGLANPAELAELAKQIRAMID